MSLAGWRSRLDCNSSHERRPWCVLPEWEGADAVARPPAPTQNSQHNQTNEAGRSEAVRWAGAPGEEQLLMELVP